MISRKGMEDGAPAVEQPEAPKVATVAAAPSSTRSSTSQAASRSPAEAVVVPGPAEADGEVTSLQAASPDSPLGQAVASEEGRSPKPAPVALQSSAAKTSAESPDPRTKSPPAPAVCQVLSPPQETLRQVKLLLAPVGSEALQPSALRKLLRQPGSWYHTLMKATTPQDLEGAAPLELLATSLILLKERLPLAEPSDKNFSHQIEEVEEKLHIVFRKIRAVMFSLAFVIVFPASVGVLCMLGYCLFDSVLGMTTKILVIADTFWKASYYTFWAIGVVTVMSAAVGSEDDNDWVKKFWSMKVPVNVKSWQATGFILKPLGLYVLGTFLFVTQIVLKEGIKSGSEWLELSSTDKQSKKCFFTEQVDWQTAQYSTSLYQNDSNFTSDFTHLQNMSWAWGSRCGREAPLSCHSMVAEKGQTSRVSGVVRSEKGYLNEAKIQYLKEDYTHSQSLTIRTLLHALWDLWRKYVRLIPDCRAYLGGEGSLWNRSYYFSERVRTACHYECAEWAEETAVTKLLQLSMVVGGGMAIVAVSDIIGGKLGSLEESVGGEIHRIPYYDARSFTILCYF
eukprot:s1055_g9.t1